MKKTKVVYAIIFLALASCRVKKEHNKNTAFNDRSTVQFSEEIDFERIKEWVKDKRVVSIGESSHGIGEFFTMKSEIVQYLHENAGYDVLAVEGGFADINLAWLDVGKLSSLDLRNKTLYGNFNCQEIVSLFTYIKESSKTDKPLYYAGFDTEISGAYYEGLLDSICTHLNLSVDLKNGFAAYYKMYQASMAADSINFTKYRDNYRRFLKSLKDSISKDKALLQEEMKLSDLALRIVLRNLDAQYSVTDYDYTVRLNEENMQQGIILRDKLMAENIHWLTETLYPDKKIIIWAHNGHVGKSGINNHSTEMMGHHLKEIYADNYFAIGLFAYKGKTYQHWTGESIAFENSDSTFIESKMIKENANYAYLEFGNKIPSGWTTRPISGLEIENGGPVSFIPSKRFDAIITIHAGDIPTFEK